MKQVRAKRLTSEQRRAQIAGAATAVFSERGFTGATTREIAAAAGISEAAIYKHFARKEDLYRAIIDYRCSDNDGEPLIRKAISGKTGRALFRTTAMHLLESHSKDPAFMRLLMFSALEKHDLSRIFIKTRGLQMLDQIEGEIKRLITTGVFRRVKSPKVAARAFLGMVLHYSLSQELFGLKKHFKEPMETVVDSFVDIFFEGMLRR